MWNDTETGSKFKSHPLRWCFLIFSLVNYREFLYQDVGFFPHVIQLLSLLQIFLFPAFLMHCLCYIQNTVCRWWRGVNCGTVVLCPAVCSRSSSRSLLTLPKGQIKQVICLSKKCKTMQAGHQRHGTWACWRYGLNGCLICCFYTAVCVCSEICADKKVKLVDVTLNLLCIWLLFLSV